MQLISDATSIIGHAIADLLAKNLFGFLGWYLRWVILKSEGGENAPSINAGFDIAEAKDHIRQMAADMVGLVAIRLRLLSSFPPFQKHILLTRARILPTTIL